MRATWALALLVGPCAWADTLAFTRIEVEARLDETGRLHVAETHAMLVGEEIQEFTWDVGLAADQRLRFGRLVRLMDDGSERPLGAGAPAQGESYFLGRAWLVIGLKERAVTIAGQTRTYRIEYQLDGALTPAWDLPAGALPLDATRSEYRNPIDRLREAQDAWREAWPALDGHYRLDHDVLLPSRAGPAFRLGTLNYRLQWDARIWRLLHPERDAGRATPGIDYRVQRTFAYLPAGRPPGVNRRGAGARVASVLAVPALGLALLLSFLLLEGVRRLRQPRFDAGRFEAAVASQPPELLSSLLALRHLPPDTESLLLRLAVERKLQIRVTQPSSDEASAKTELRLLADPSSLRAHESALVSALFDPNERQTTSERVQQRYRGRAFDPDEVIARAFGEHPLPTMGRRQLLSVLRLALAAVGFAFAIRDLEQTALDPFALGAGVVVGGVLMALMPSGWWRGLTAASALALLLPLAALSLAPPVLHLVPNRPLGVDASLALAFLTVSHYAWYLATLPRPKGPSGPLLEQLWSARRWASAELRRELPRLRDAWIPHLEALALQGSLERWRNRHAGSAGGAAPDLAAVESGEALPGPPFTGYLPRPPGLGGEDWSGAFYVWEEDEGAL